MNLEAIDLYKQTQYLSQKITGAKIIKIFMPSPSSLLLQLYKNKTLNLICNLAGNGPALYLTDTIPPNPDTPPSFCMLLRKHLEEGKITAVTQRNFDRIIAVTIDILDHNNQIITKELIFELTGQTNNIVFVQNNLVIDCLKHIGTNSNRVRVVLPNEKYTLPPSKNGLHPLAVEPEKLTAAILANPAENLTEKILQTLCGIGKRTATFLANQDNLTAAIKNLQTRYSTPPTDELNNYIQEQMAQKPPQLERKIILQQTVKNEIAKTNKRVQALKKDLANADNADIERIKADTLMANLTSISKGQILFKTPSIYDNTMLEIKLNPELSPNDNAQTYYKRYNKFKRAKTELAKQITQAEQQLLYLESIAVSLDTSQNKQEIEEINEELINIGIIKKGKRKKAVTTLSQPLHIHLNNADIYIGKNNRQNDFVTFKIAKTQDLWFHTKEIPGSHVVLQGEHSPENIKLAQMLAAWFSQGRQGSNIPVDMVEKKYVKKPSGAQPGFVIFTNNRTSFINIDEKKIKEILK